MFGYVTIRKDDLKVKDYNKYQAYYCGLCQDIKEAYGKKGQAMLTFDMTFLSILLTGLYECETKEEEHYCFLHPGKKHKCLRNKYTKYCADMNVLLAYYNLLDDWEDEKNYAAFTAAKALKKSVTRIEASYPRQTKAVQDYLEKLHACEKENNPDLDLAAGYTGEVMAEIYIPEEDIWSVLYRMKQNAVGLANICILSTGVLLVISISTCLWTGIEEVTYTRFPHQISIEANTGVSGIMKTVEPVSQKMIEEVKTGIDQHLEEKQLRKKYESDQRYYVMLADVDRNKVEKTQSDDAAASTLIKIMEESEYNQVTGEQVELEPGQALVFQAKQKNYGYDTIELGNQTYEVKKWNTDKKSYILDEKTQVYETMTVVTRNHEAKEAYAAVQGKEPEGYSWEYALDLIGDAGEQITVGDEIETILTESSFNGWVEVREKERNTVYSLYGSLLFLGVFVGTLFLMGAVMIIYYKQVSEGFDDRKRFQIMQKVGMSRKEIRQTIQSQVVTVFFLPLAVAVVHTMVAFPLTRRIMAMLNFPDSNLFLAATAITIAAFAVVYLIVYVLTARAYYKIVE